MHSLWQSNWWRVVALEAVVVSLGGVLLLALARIVSARGIAQHLASLLTLP
jgi:hypothetical protein